MTQTAPTHRTIPFRYSLAANLLLVILLLGGALLATTYLGSRRAQLSLARSLMKRTASQTEEQLRHFFQPVEVGLRSMQEWVTTGLLDAEDPEATNRLLLPLIRNAPQVSSLLVADERGREHMLLRGGSNWRSRQTRADEWGETKRFLTWSNEDPTPRAEDRSIQYDPRSRPWFQEAIAAADAAGTGPSPLHWTEPYTFFTTGDPGITASVAFSTADGLRQVVGLDVLLGDISAFTRGIETSQAGMVFVLTEDAQVIGLPEDPRFATAEQRRAAYLKRPEELGLQVAADAASAFYAASSGENALRFQSGGDPWWCEAHPLRLSGGGTTLWVGVVVPEADLLGGLVLLRRWILIITLVVLFLGVARAVLLARGYSKPLEELAERHERIARGDLEPGTPIVTHITEVEELAAAQERMRAALASLSKLERDLQLARQIQQKTFPKSLPQLPGFALGAWSEPADETGGDTYDIIGLLTRKDAPVLVSVEEADRAVLLMADATGHGIGPALSVTQIRAMLRMAVRTGLDLARFARHLNDQLCADLHFGRFITAWLGELDTKDHTLRALSAGQGPLLHYRADTGECSVANADVPPFGILEDTEYALPPPLAMQPGDFYIVLSDGIYEASSPAGELFGSQRVADLIKARAADAPDTLIRTLRAAVNEFTTGAPPGDDRTGIIIKRVAIP